VSVRIHRLIVGAFLVLMISNCVTLVSAQDSKRLLSYYPYWAKWNTPSYTARQIPYEKMTHILHAFLALKANGQGGIVVPDGLIEDELISRAHAAGVKVMISVGGADSIQSAAFSILAANPDYRRAFAHNLHDFMLRYGYDGVDIDWEVPNAPQDTVPCIMMMQTLREELPAPRWLISMAIGSDPRGYGTGFDVPALAPLLDFINVMTYDFHGPWTNHAGHNSPLFLNHADPGLEGSVETSIDLFTQLFGVSPQKLNIGTAFYGYEFGTVQNLWGFCHCETTTLSVNYGNYIKQRINLQDWGRFFDADAQAPYLLYQGHGNDPGFITYDDEASTARKVSYALVTRDLGGAFMWDVSADYDGYSQDLLNAMYNAWLNANRAKTPSFTDDR
jgi:chitinase